MNGPESHEPVNIPPLAAEAVVLLGVATVARLVERSGRTQVASHYIAELCGVVGAMTAGVAIGEVVHKNPAQYHPGVLQTAKATIKATFNIRP